MKTGRDQKRRSPQGKHEAYSGRHVSRGGTEPGRSRRSTAEPRHIVSESRRPVSGPPRQAEAAPPEKALRRAAARAEARPRVENPLEKKPRRRRKIGWKERLVVILPALAAIIVVSLALLLTEKNSSYELPDSGAQYYAGHAVKLQRGEVLKLEEDGSVSFKSGRSESSLPIYLDNSRSVVLSCDMYYYMPRSGSCGRAAALSEVSCTGSGSVRLSRNGSAENLETGFLYDGEDMYIFLEPVTVSYMGKSVQLSALSYAEVPNGGSIMLFDYESGEFTMEFLESQVTAGTTYGEYNISLLGDTMYNMDGGRTLLMTKPGEIDPIV